MLNGPFSPWPSFTREEADAVSDVLLSNKVNYWTGTECREFEKEFAAFSGTQHAIAVANGTLALDLILHGLGIGQANGGSATDEVIVTPRSFMASVSSVVTAGARPVFADVDPKSGNMSAEGVAAVLSANTRAVICVHLGGWPCDMDAISAVTTAHTDEKIFMIEDCAQAHGALYKGKPVGSLGDAAAWSFCQDKIMTTGGEGGMVTCDDTALWNRMWSFKDHGKDFDRVYNMSHPPGFRWLHANFGTNWRLTEMQAVLGRIQLKRMPEWQATRAQNANALADIIAQVDASRGAIVTTRDACSLCQNKSEIGCRHAWYKFYAYIDPTKLKTGWTRDRVVQEINTLGVPCFQGSCSEIYRETAFDGTDLRPETPLPHAHDIGERSIMMLVHPTLTKHEIDHSCTVLKQVLIQAFGVAN